MTAAVREKEVAAAVELRQDLKSAREKSYGEVVEVEAVDHRLFLAADSKWVSWRVVRDQASQAKVEVWANQAFLQRVVTLHALFEEAVALADMMGSEGVAAV